MKKMTVIMGIILTVLAIAAGVFLVVPGFNDATFFQALLNGSLQSFIAIFTFKSVGIISIAMFAGYVLVACLFITMIIVSIAKKRGVIVGMAFPFLIWELVALIALQYVICVDPIFLESGVSTTANWSQFVTFGVSLAAALAGICFSIVSMLLESKAKLVAQKPVDIITQATSVPEPVEEEKPEEPEPEEEKKEEEKPEEPEPKPEEEKPQDEEEEVIAQIHEVEEKVESPLDNENEPKVEALPQEPKAEPEEEPKAEEPAPEPTPEEPKPEEKPAEPVDEPKEEFKTDKVYHVSKRKGDGKWIIKFAKGTKVIKTFNTKDEAVKYAYELADRQNARVAIHASKGQFKGKIRSIE